MMTMAHSSNRRARSLPPPAWGLLVFYCLLFSTLSVGPLLPLTRAQSADATAAPAADAGGAVGSGAECGGFGHLHGGECHCDDGYATAQEDLTVCIPAAAVDDAECGGFGHLHGGECHCDDGYATAQEDLTVCLPAGPTQLWGGVLAQDSWTSMFETANETPEEHIWHLLQKEEGESIGVDEVQTLLDAASGLIVEVQPEEEDHRRLLQDEMCGGNGHPHGGECHCDSGYMTDPLNSMNCVSVSAPPASAGVGASDWNLGASGVISYAGHDGTLTMADLAVALPLIHSCQLDPSCSLVVSEQPSPTTVSPETPDTEVELWMAWVATIAFFLCPLVGMSIPAISARFTSPAKTAVLISLGNCLSASMIFALGIMHIIPETVEGMYKLNMGYPLNYLLIVVGFFVTLVLEDMVHVDGDDGHDHGPALPKTDESSAQDGKVAPQDPSLVPAMSNISSENDTESGTQTTETEDKQAQKSSAVAFIRWALPSLVFFLAIQFHACLEAIIVGMQTSVTNFWTLFAGVIIHKVLVSFAFGVRMQSTLLSAKGTTKWQVVYVYLMMALWALLPAVCVMLGYLLAESINYLAKVVLGSLAGGVFIYMGAYALLVPEFHMGAAHKQQEGAWGSSPSHKFIKYAFLALGILLVTMLSLIPHKHD